MSSKNSNSLLLLKVKIERERRRRAALRSAIDNRPKPPKFRGAGLEIQSFTGPEWILSGPAETGKTFAALWRLDSLLRSTPGAKATLARKIQSSIYSTVLITLERILAFQRQLGNDEVHIFGGTKPQLYSYTNGSRLWVGGMDNAAKILSGERDLIYINQAEELTLEDWETLLTRTTGRGAVIKHPMLFGDCNPGGEDHWILGRETLKVFHSKHVDNPSLYFDDGRETDQGERSMTRLKSLTGIRRKRLYEGVWVGAEGLFFEEFDEDLHTCDPFDIPEDWPIWGALDYGFAHPTAIGLFTMDSDGKIYLIAEHVQHKWLPPLHCIAIRAQAERRGINWNRVTTVVAGHDVFQEKGASDGKTHEDQYNDAIDPITGEWIGIANLEKAHIARKFGANELLTRLGNREMNVKPTLQIFKTCRRTIQTLTRMVTNPNDEEDVLKVNADINGLGGDDPYDMIRYGVASRPEPPAKSGKTVGMR